MAAVGTQSAGEKAPSQMKHSSNAKSGQAEDDTLKLFAIIDASQKVAQSYEMKEYRPDNPSGHTKLAQYYPK